MKVLISISIQIIIKCYLFVGAVHHHLIETRNRMRVALVIETGEAREVHHICCLLGYGADAICPYLALELAAGLREDGALDSTFTDDVIFESYAQAMRIGMHCTELFLLLYNRKGHLCRFSF